MFINMFIVVERFGLNPYGSSIRIVLVITKIRHRGTQSIDLSLYREVPGRPSFRSPTDNIFIALS